MATSGWCITARHGASCKYAPCSCRCHALSAAKQLALANGEIRLDEIPISESQEGGESDDERGHDDPETATNPDSTISTITTGRDLRRGAPPGKLTAV